MKILKSTSRAIQGSTLMIVVVITGLVGLVLAAYLNLLCSQNATTMRSQAWNAAIPVIEAGVEDALTHLNSNGTNNLASDGWSQSGSVYWIQRYIGSNYYIVTISNYVVGAETNSPNIESRGFVTSPILVASSQSIFLADPVNPSAPAFLGRGVRVNAKRHYMFTKGLVAKDSIDMNGNNITTDSYDSANPSYSSASGLYDPAKRRAHGDVAVNSSLLNSLSVGNANIYGGVATGPNGSVAIGPSGVVGDMPWHVTPGTGIEPTMNKNDMNVDFQDVLPPFNGGAFTPNNTGGFITNTVATLTVASNWAGGTTITYPWGASSVTTNYPITSTTFPAGSPGPVSTTLTPNTTPATSSVPPALGTYVGNVTVRVVTTGPQSGRGTWYDYNAITSTTTTYTYPTFTATYSSYNTNSTTTVKYYDYILDSGNYQATDLNGGSPGQPASIYVRGNAILYVTDSCNLGGNAANNTGIVIQPGKSLRLYCSAPSVNLGGNENGFASAFSYFGLPGNTSLDIGGNGQFTGTVYAPNAALKLNGGGNNTIDFMGASITKSVKMNGHFNFHYDEALGRIPTGGNYIVTSWDEMAPNDVSTLPQGVSAN